MTVTGTMIGEPMPTACACYLIGHTASGACFGSGPERSHRYALWRRWSDGLLLLVVMLNPSTADENVPDPTIRRVATLARAAGCGGFLVVNAFALRSPAPELLKADPQAAIGSENDAHLRALVRHEDVGPRVVAWGANIGWKQLAFRLAAMRELLGDDVLCWDVTAAGHPKHPHARGAHRIPDETLPRAYRWPA